MAIRNIKDNRGFTIVELLIVGSFLIIAMFPLVTSLNTLNSQTTYIGGRVQSKIEALQLLLQMANLGRVASTCVNPNQTSLICRVTFDPATGEEEVRFDFDPLAETLTYTRNNRTIWLAEAVEAFSVCNGDEIRIAECRDGNGTWSGSNLDHVDPINLRHFFRARVTVSVTHRPRPGAALVKNGNFTVQTGFYNRNTTAADVPKYVWAPMGGS